MQDVNFILSILSANKLEIRGLRCYEQKHTYVSISNPIGLWALEANPQKIENVLVASAASSFEQMFGFVCFDWFV